LPFFGNGLGWWDTEEHTTVARFDHALLFGGFLPQLKIILGAAEEIELPGNLRC